MSERSSSLLSSRLAEMLKTGVASVVVASAVVPMPAEASTAPAKSDLSLQERIDLLPRGDAATPADNSGATPGEQLAWGNWHNWRNGWPNGWRNWHNWRNFW